MSETTGRVIVWNYGGGTQSVAIAVLVAQGKLPAPECALIARMDREVPRTFDYLDRYVRPLLAPVGVEIRVVYPDALTAGLYYRDDDPLPLVGAFTAQGRTPALCSAHWKRDRIYREFRALGYGPARPVEQWFGYSAEPREIARAAKARKGARRQWARPTFPLIERIPLRREHCVRLVEQAGLPTPPRSRCFDCYNQTNEEWREVRDATPELYQLAVRRDHEIRARDPKHALYLHHSRVPLDQADIEERDDESTLFGTGCDSAGCWT
jgi:hypothetical protein